MHTIPSDEAKILRAAERLFDAMEKLDPTFPTKPRWSDMAPEDREFFRYCAKEVLLSGPQSAESTASCHKVSGSPKKGEQSYSD